MIRRFCVLSVVLAVILLVSGCGPPSVERSVRLALYQNTPCYSGDENRRTEHLAHFPLTLSSALHSACSSEEGIHVVNTLLAESNAYLNQLTISRSVSMPDIPQDDMPHLFIGDAGSCRYPGQSIADSLLPDYDMDSERPLTAIHILGPSVLCREAMEMLAEETDTDWFLCIRLCVDEFAPVCTGNTCSLSIGTGYTVPVPSGNAVNGTVLVIHYTGMLMNKHGAVVRAGSEGIGVVSRQETGEDVYCMPGIPAADLRRLCTCRRTDLPAQPPTWQIALSTLVQHLLGN